MTQICRKWLKYVWKWLDYLTNGFKMWKMTQRFGNGTKIWEIVEIHWAQLKYLKNAFPMLQMASEFDKRLKYVGNDVKMWENGLII